MLRFAHSSSKELDISALRVALINYIVAKKQNEGFIIRIKDLIDTKDKEDKSSEVIDVLKKFAIDSEQKIYQSQNEKMYQNFALKLLQEGKAFACFCTKEEIEKEKKLAKEQNRNYTYSQKCQKLTQEEIANLKNSKAGFVIRVQKPNENIEFTDKIYGKISKTPDEIDSFIILDENGKPAQVFADAIDDMLSNITLVIQEQKELQNTPKEIYIQKLLGYESQTEYASLPELKNSITIKELFKEGFLPDAIINYLLSSNINKEIFYLPDAIESFDLDKINKENSSFDIDKLKTINKKHLKAMDSKKLSKIFGFADSDIGELAKLYLNDFSTINELDSKIKAIFSPKDCTNKNMQLLAKTIQNAPMIDSFEEFKSYLLANTNLQEEELCKLLKPMLTNSNDNIELEKVYQLIKPYLLEVARCH